MVMINVVAEERNFADENEPLLTSQKQALITESVNTYEGGTQTAIFPMDNLNVSQITHPETASDAVDFRGIDTGSENVFAPFDAVVVDKMTAFVMGNTIVIQSRSPVKYADGTVDYMTVSFTHDNDVSDLWVGKNITKGEVFYQEGEAGYATGNHIHMICARGQYGVNTIWDHGAGNGLTNSLWPDKALFISSRTNIIYTWWFNWVADLPSDTTPPTISNILITDIDAEGFTVHCNVSDNVGVTRVNYATWTDANGQDELNFVDGVLSGGGSAFRVLYRDHKNERGSYKVDIRAYDAAGNCVGPITTGTTVDETPPTVENVEVIDQSPYGYQIKCKVADNNGINRVQFPTWTSANGQDDINGNWSVDAACSGIIEGDTVTYTVKDSDHRFERGEYNTHIYAYDTFGNQKVYEIKQNVINKDNIVSEETLNNHRYMSFDDILNWKEAEAKAEELGGTLVTIASQDEQSLVERLIGVV